MGGGRGSATQPISRPSGANAACSPWFRAGRATVLRHGGLSCTREEILTSSPSRSWTVRDEGTSSRDGRTIPGCEAARAEGLPRAWGGQPRRRDAREGVALASSLPVPLSDVTLLADVHTVRRPGLSCGDINFGINYHLRTVSVRRIAKFVAKFFKESG